MCGDEELGPFDVKRSQGLINVIHICDVVSFVIAIIHSGVVGIVQKSGESENGLK